MFDLISIGDTVIDTFVPVLDAQLHLQNGIKMLCLPYGNKIPVGESVSTVGGNAANNAVGSARLSLKTAVYTNTGDDPDDKRIKNKLKKEGIDIRYVIESKDLPSNHNILLDFKGERTILIHHQAWKYDLPDLDRTRWMYLTSMASSYLKSNIIQQVIRYLERTGAKMLYNPGTFQIQGGVKKNPHLLSLTELFIVNKEESEIILGTDHKSGKIEIKKLLKHLHDLGPSQVIITDGGSGSYGYDGKNYYHLEIFPAELVEMTGAGDAYATGVLAGLFYGKDLPESMRWGAANGAAVVAQIGAQTGLLNYHQMQQRLNQHSKIKAKII